MTVVESVTDMCGLCSPATYVVLGCVTLVNIVLLLYNVCTACSRQDPPSPHSTLSTHRRDIRTIRNFQAYLSQQHAAAAASVVLPSENLEQSVTATGHMATNTGYHGNYKAGHVSANATFTPPSESSIPEQVNCTHVYPHRNIFIGRIVWCGYEGFLKECINPRELYLHRKLKHENVVRFYWCNVLDKPRIILPQGLECSRELPVSFYCMEYCPKGSLRDFLVDQGHGIDIKQILNIVCDTVSGLQYLHTLKVAHRDIKPDNVLVLSVPDVQGRLAAKISDFDHAIDTKEPYDMRLEQRRSSNFGSPLYTAPEFIQGTIENPVAADFFRHDIYSLSLVIWECMTWIKCKNRYKPTTPGSDVSLTASLLPREQTNELTTDIGQFRSLVNCSSTVHLPLLKQICDTLKLKYSKEEEVLRVNNLFLKKGRLIDTGLMKEFYSKKPDARPTIFRVHAGDWCTREVNTVLEGCWRREPEGRFSVDRVKELVENIRQTAFSQQNTC